MRRFSSCNRMNGYLNGNGWIHCSMGESKFHELGVHWSEEPVADVSDWFARVVPWSDLSTHLRLDNDAVSMSLVIDQLRLHYLGICFQPDGRNMITCFFSDISLYFISRVVIKMYRQYPDNQNVRIAKSPSTYVMRCLCVQNFSYKIKTSSTYKSEGDVRAYIV